MDLESADIQAIIITGYGHLPWSRYLFLHVDDAASSRRWLADVAARVTHAAWGTDGAAAKPTSAANLAFTSDGLLAIGLDAAAITTFPEELVQGMANPARAQRLGDNGASDPSAWELGNPATPAQREIHILLIVKAADNPSLDLLTEQHRALLGSYGGLSEISPAETGRPLAGQKEHFGFHDSISQPDIDGTPKGAKAGKDCVKAGEFVLGYENEYGMLPAAPSVAPETDVFQNLQAFTAIGLSPQAPIVKDPGRNGSYMVFRKLQQDVASFRQYIAAVAPPAGRELMAAKFVGRWPSGTPLVLSPHYDNAPADATPSNDFFYADSDPYGHSCPLAAHIRRTNPRDSQEDRLPADSLTDVRRHRILRRGASYGAPLPAKATSDDGQPRGLLFICINADIKRQFELIQQTWSNNPKFHGLIGDRDPLIGDNVEPGDKVDRLAPRTFTIQRDGVRTRLSSIPRFVTMKGGAYFFLPSISALYYLARAQRPQGDSGRGGKS